MSDDLPELVRATYETTIKRLRSDTAAYEAAVKRLLDHMPNLARPEARREVARILAGILTDAE
jgi:hypothetical protein